MTAKMRRNVVTAIATVMLAITYVACGFVAVAGIPQMVHGLAMSYCNDDLSPFDKMQLVEAADAARRNRGRPDDRSATGQTRLPSGGGGQYAHARRHLASRDVNDRGQPRCRRCLRGSACSARLFGRARPAVRMRRPRLRCSSLRGDHELQQAVAMFRLNNSRVRVFSLDSSCCIARKIFGWGWASPGLPSA